MELEKELGFDLYGRYALIRDIIDKCRTSKKKLKILDVGGRGNLLKAFMPKDEVWYLDPNIDASDKNFIKADGCDMPLEDGSFDWVVSADVLEHIPKGKRNVFLEEQYRVASEGVVVVAPFFSKTVEKAEININENFKKLYGIDHPWLIEHIENHLPDFIHIEEFAKSKKIQIQAFNNNELSLWELGQNFLLNADKSGIDPAGFTEYYNTFYSADIHESNSYRKLVLLPKKEIRSIKFTPKTNFFEFSQNVVGIINSKYNEGFQTRQLELDSLKNNYNLLLEGSKVKKAQLYYSASEILNEENSAYIEINTGPQYLCYDLGHLVDHVSFFRFDPADHECAVSLDNIELVYSDGVEYIKPNESNAFLTDYNTYYFNCLDPNIYFLSDESRKIEKVIVRCNYLNFEKATFNTLLDVLNEKVKNNFIDVNDLNSMKKELVDVFFLMNSKSDMFKNSKSIDSKLSSVLNYTINGQKENRAVAEGNAKLIIEENNRRFDEIAEQNSIFQTKLNELRGGVEENLELSNVLKQKIDDNCAHVNNNVSDLHPKLDAALEGNSTSHELLHKLTNISDEIDTKLSAFVDVEYKEISEKNSQGITEVQKSLEEKYSLLNKTIESKISAQKEELLQNLKDINKEISIVQEKGNSIHNTLNNSEELLTAKIVSVLEKLSATDTLIAENNGAIAQGFDVSELKYSQILEKVQNVIDFNNELFVKKEREWNMDSNNKKAKISHLEMELENIHSYINKNKIRKFFLRNYKITISE